MLLWNIFSVTSFEVRRFVKNATEDITVSFGQTYRFFGPIKKSHQLYWTEFLQIPVNFQPTGDWTRTDCLLKQTWILLSEVDENN